MNDQSLKKFQLGLKQKGILLFDSSLIKNPEPRQDIEVIGVPATNIASTIGNTKSANMVLLGALIGRTKLLKEQSALEAIEDSLDHRKEVIAMNRKAVREGMHFLEDKKG
jgi:Pyruvate/2-oxoacid:ferredoxin oxidoreductase gamma subunit